MYRKIIFLNSTGKEDVISSRIKVISKLGE